MSIVKFGDVVKEVKGKVDRDNNPYDYYIAGDHMDSEDLHLHRKGSFATDDVGPAFIREFLPGQILYGSRRTYLKKIAVADFAGVTANTTFVLETKDENVLRQKLIPFIMLSEGFTEWSIGKSKGSTNPYVLFSDLADYEFNLPDIDIQDMLVDLLWSMDDAVVAYKNAIEKTDELVKSQFIEMFGAPFTENCIPNGKFGDFTLEMLKGPFGSDMKKTLLVEKGDDTYKVYLQVNAIQQNEHLGESYISKEYYDSKMNRFAAYPGDYLITCDGTLGKFIRLDEEMEPGVISPSLLKIKLNEDAIVPRFFEAYWELFIVDYLVARTRNTALVHLPSAKVIGDVELFIPELGQQHQYAEFAKQSDKSKFEVKDALENVNAMRIKIVEDNFYKDRKE